MKVRTSNLAAGMLFIAGLIMSAGTTIGGLFVANLGMPWRAWPVLLGQAFSFSLLAWANRNNGATLEYGGEQRRSAAQPEHPGTLLSLLGVTMLALGLSRRRSQVVVDWHGIRRIGEPHWTLAWQQIRSARVGAGELIVEGLENLASNPAPGEIQDSYHPEQQTLRPADELDSQYRVSVAAGDEAEIEAAIEAHLARFDSTEVAMIEPADPNPWPLQAPDLEPEEVEASYQQPPEEG